MRHRFKGRSPKPAPIRISSHKRTTRPEPQLARAQRGASCGIKRIIVQRMSISSRRGTGISCCGAAHRRAQGRGSRLEAAHAATGTPHGPGRRDRPGPPLHGRECEIPPVWRRLALVPQAAGVLSQKPAPHRHAGVGAPLVPLEVVVRHAPSISRAGR